MRTPFVHLLTAVVLAVAAAGCIIVVEEDDDYYSELHGSSWYLEIIWIHGHSHRVQQQDYALSFASENELTGTAGCASFTAGYDLADQEIRINRFRTSTFGCQDDDLRSLFLEHLPEVSDLEVDGVQLEMTTEAGNRLVFGR